MTTHRYGFAGLGNMGGPMAANIAGGGFDLVVYDKAGTRERAPEGAEITETLAEVAAAADSLFLCLPDGPVVLTVAAELAALPERRVKTVIDLSTIGIKAAQEANALLGAAGITYIDAPVSGGQAGARAGTITVMWAGPEGSIEEHRDVLAVFSGNPFHVGVRAGQGQAVKLLNNFLSATAMVATSEAMTFAVAQGLDMQTVLDVVNVSTGQNTATRDKFPQRIVTGSYDAGFATALLTKDVRLYLENVEDAGTPGVVGRLIADIWRRADEAMPGSDFTRIHEFVRDGGKG